MFIISVDQEHRDEYLGVIAEMCPTCERPRRFTVIDRYVATQVLFVTVGGWQREARMMHCFRCDLLYPCQLKNYDDIVTEEAAEKMSLLEVARITNIPLAEWMEEQRIQREEEREERQRSRRKRYNDDDEEG
jgi:CO dehydrogenase/acetyl-CoA synthase beta subunit